MSRLKLAIKILLGYNIIFYEKGTKIIYAIIKGNNDIIRNGFDYDIAKLEPREYEESDLRYYESN